MREHFKSLSQRERDVVVRVATGGLNKQIAADLGVSEVTVKVHRANAMRKLRVKSVAELVRLCRFHGHRDPGKSKLKPTQLRCGPIDAASRILPADRARPRFPWRDEARRRKTRALGNIEKAVGAVGQIEHPQERHLRALARHWEQPPPPQLRLAVGAKIAECDIALQEIDRFEQRAERAGKLLLRYEVEIVGGGMVLLVFAMRCTAEASDRKIEAGEQYCRSS